MSSARLCLVTAPDREVGLRLARALLERRLVACVNVIDGVTSVYRWEGETCEDAEVLLVCKTSAERVAELEASVLELHPYDTPEFCVLAPEHVEARYLAWLQGETALE